MIENPTMTQCCSVVPSDTVTVGRAPRPNSVSVQVATSRTEEVVVLSPDSAADLGHELIRLAGATRKRPNGPQKYQGAQAHTWEDATEPDSHHETDRTKRLRVPGGWLYRVGQGQPVFVPMPDAVGYEIWPVTPCGAPGRPGAQLDATPTWRATMPQEIVLRCQHPTRCVEPKPMELRVRPSHIDPALAALEIRDYGGPGQPAIFLEVGVPYAVLRTALNCAENG